MKLLRPAGDLRLALEVMVALARSLWEHGRNRSDLRNGPPLEGGGEGVAPIGRGDVRRIGRAVVKISRFFPGGSNCLVRAQTVRRMLDRRKVPSEVRFAVREGGHGRIEAHAWVESGDLVVIGKGCPDGYRVLEAAPRREGP